MKINVFIVLFLCLPIVGQAQIQITPYIPDEVCCKLPNGICDKLSQKLSNIVSANHIQSSLGDSRFILTCDVSEDSKDILATAPIKIAYVLDINLYIGDGIEGVKYISNSFKTKGVGETEEKAYLNAIKNLNAHSQAMKDFVLKGKDRIINYYEDNKSKILASIQSALVGKDFERSMYEICLIPMEVSYYEEVQELAGIVQSTIINNEAQNELLKAKSMWAANQDNETANSIIEIISNINPSADCYNEAKAFIESVKKRLEQINNREWAEYKAKMEHERRMEVERETNRNKLEMAKLKSSEKQNIARTEAYRQVAIAYAQSRPRIVYRVNNWYRL